jgi:predicted 2-oxoglutarate/Fe(II)-dependent dioxygenase YbiX
VSRYDAKEGGFFKAHRDNTTKGTAHRKFAVTINLNAEQYEGGDLRVPEFGQQAYRAPTGGAVVFSCSLLHEALPVTKGTRYAYLPFLYDEEGAKVRDANRQFLDRASGGVADVGSLAGAKAEQAGSEEKAG